MSASARTATRTSRCDDGRAVSRDRNLSACARCSARLRQLRSRPPRSITERWSRGRPRLRPPSGGQPEGRPWRSPARRTPTASSDQEPIVISIARTSGSICRRARCVPSAGTLVHYGPSRRARRPQHQHAPHDTQKEAPPGGSRSAVWCSPAPGEIPTARRQRASSTTTASSGRHAAGWSLVNPSACEISTDDWPWIRVAAGSCPTTVDLVERRSRSPTPRRAPFRPVEHIERGHPHAPKRLKRCRRGRGAASLRIGRRRRRSAGRRPVGVDVDGEYDQPASACRRASRRAPARGFTGTHQLAQKSRQTTLPRKSASATGRSCQSRSVKSSGRSPTPTPPARAKTASSFFRNAT
jgi:hypothetical protein